MYTVLSRRPCAKGHMLCSSSEDALLKGSLLGSKERVARLAPGDDHSKNHLGLQPSQYPHVLAKALPASAHVVDLSPEWLRPKIVFNSNELCQDGGSTVVRPHATADSAVRLFTTEDLLRSSLFPSAAGATATLSLMAAEPKPKFEALYGVISLPGLADA